MISPRTTPISRPRIQISLPIEVGDRLSDLAFHSNVPFNQLAVGIIDGWLESQEMNGDELGVSIAVRAGDRAEGPRLEVVR